MPESRRDPRDSFKSLPSVDELMQSPVGRAIAESAGEPHAATLSRRIVARLRKGIDQRLTTKRAVFDDAVSQLERDWRAEQMKRLRRVINATGVVIHTNLGRAP